MADRELKATIIGVDKASPIFAQVANGAQKMGTAVKSSADKASQALKDNKKAADDLKIGFAGLGAAFALAARSNQSQEQQIRGLQRAYGDATDDIERLADSMQDMGIASDDAIRQSALAASTLTREYGLTADQAQVLIQRAADLTAIYGGSLVDNVNRLASATRGEAEAAEFLGIAMADSVLQAEAAARGMDGWTTTMTEAEKAQVRFDVLLEQTAFAQGTAAQAADTTSGKVRALVFDIQDMAQGFADATGPIGETVAVLSDYALQVGLAAGGAAKLGSGLKALGGVGALTSLAMGPVGLAAAIGVAAIAIDQLVDGTKEFEASAGTARIVADDFAEALVKLKTGGSEATDEFSRVTAEFARLLTQQVEAIELQTAGIDKITAEEAEKIKDSIIEIFANPMIDEGKAAEAILKLFRDFSTGVIEDSDDLANAIAAINNNWAQYAKGVDQAATATKEFSGAIAALDSAIGDMNEVRLSPDLIADIETIKEFGSSDAKMAFQSYVDQFKQTGDLDTFAVRVDGIADRIEAQAAAEQQAERAILATTRAQDQQTFSLGNLFRQSNETAASLTGTGKSLKELQDEAVLATAATDDNAFSLGNLFKTANENAPQIVEDWRAQEQATIDATNAMVDYANALVGTIALATKLRPLDIEFRGGDKVTGTADEMIRASTALDNVLSVFGQLDSMGKSAGEATSIAEQLVGTPEEVGTALKLLEEGRISRTRYNMTVEAGNAIIGRQAEIEKDLDVIRTRQLPFLDEASAKYADLVDDISHMNTEQQAATLGFMDQNKAMQANNALALAAAAANTEVGSTARQAAQASIEGAIAADPYLEAMLTSIGLVARDHEGNLIVNFDNADELNRSTDNLTAAINALTAALNGVPPHVQTSITAIDNATGTLNDVANLMAQLDGRVSNVTVQTNYVQTGDGSQVGGYLGGVAASLPSYAMGGMVTANLAEVGAELLSFRNGGQALVTNPGVYTIPASTYVHTVDATRSKLGRMSGGGFVFNNYGPINGVSGIDEVVDSFERALRSHLVGLGVL
jgi:hypothetical protein